MNTIKNKLKSTFDFFANIKRDLIVTVWPDKNEMIKTTIFVIFFAILFGAFISLSDIILSKFYNLVVF
jgi:preprotein translocase SecE subunit